MTIEKYEKKRLDESTEEELIFQFASQIGQDLAVYYADRFANRAKKDIYDKLINNIDKIRPKIELIKGINNKEGYVSKQAIFDYFEKNLLPINSLAKKSLS